MASPRDEIKEIADEAMGIISKMDPVHYSLLETDPDDMAVFKTKVEKTVEELFDMIDKIRTTGDTLTSVDEALVHLPADRIELIRNSLKSQTFVMAVVQDRSTKKATLTKDGKEFHPPIELPSLKATSLQIASIIVESVILVLNVIGISIPSNSKALAKAIKVASTAFSTVPALIRLVQKLKTATGKGDVKGMAVAILEMAYKLFTTGFFVKIAKALLSDMRWYDWLLTAAKIAAFFVALVATGGIAEVAILVKLLLSAGDFIRKIANLRDFENLSLE